MEAATAQPDVSLMNSLLRIHGVAVVLVALVGCGPADERLPDAACTNQPGPRSQQSCFAESEVRYATVVNAFGPRELKAGADTATVRARQAAFDSRLATCGARPDTSGRPSSEELMVWRCREAVYHSELVQRTPK